MRMAERNRGNEVFGSMEILGLGRALWIRGCLCSSALLGD